VIGKVGRLDAFAPILVPDPYDPSVSTLQIRCDNDWSPVEDVSTVPSRMIYPRVTHREICLLTLGFRMKLVTPMETITSPNPDESAFFFTREPVPNDFVQVEIVVVPGIATGTQH
jgi:hypothetical protein